MTSAYTTEPRRLRRATNGRPATTAALVVAIIVILVAAPRAQQPAPTFAASAAAPSAAPAAMTDAPTDVDLLVGRSTVLNIGSPIARVSLTVPDIADAMVTTPTQLLIHGKQPGTISLFVWDRAGAIRTFEVKVRRDLTPLIAHLKQLFPNESITVMGSGKDVVVSGTVTSKYVMEKAAEVAGGYVDKKENVVNLLQQQEGIASNQVMLRVRFAEVSRSALQELGASFFANNARSKWFGRTTTGQFPAPEWDEQGRLVFSDFLNLFVLNSKEGLGAVVRALSNKGLFQSLAEPNLIASNGKEASFLAGGEYPYPIATPSGSGTSFSIMFKEYGVRLNFTPTVLGGDMVHIKVRPEVSALDFANAITLEGFRIPALTTRRTETEVELHDGQTFAIAGLMNNTLTTALSKIPGIGDIPILGLLFQSKAHQKNQTELVVMITPQIIKRGQPGVSEGLPSLVEPYLGPNNKPLPNPGAYVGSPRYPVTKVLRPRRRPAARRPLPLACSRRLRRLRCRATRCPSRSRCAAAPASEPSQPQAATPAADQPQPAPTDGASVSQPLTKQQLKALEQAREEERKAAERARVADEKAAEQQRKANAAAEKQRVEQEKRDAEVRKAEEKRRAEEARKAEELKKQGAQLELERQKREADVARKNAEEARRQTEEDEKRQKALTDAAQRLKQAQEAYQAEIARTTVAKGGDQITCHRATCDVLVSNCRRGLRHAGAPKAQAGARQPSAASPKEGSLMNNRLRRLARNESGMSYVFIGLGFTAFLSASMLAIDVGMLMTARNQAQNAADAGALAGATALLYDNWNDRSAERPGRHQRDRRRHQQQGDGGHRLGEPGGRGVPARSGRAADARQGHGAPHGGARQSRVDADCQVLRDRHRRHRRHRDRRGLAGQRDDLREAVHRARSLERTAVATVGRQRHLRRVRQQGPSARESRRLHPRRQAGLHRLQPGVDARPGAHHSRRDGLEHHGQLLLLARARQTGDHRRRGIRLEHRATATRPSTTGTTR